MVAHWKLNEAGLGRAYDFSGNMNHGVNSGVTSTAGTYAANFDGSNDYVDCGTDTDYDVEGNFSISAWCKNDDTTFGGQEHILGKYTGSNGQRCYRLLGKDTDKLVFNVGIGNGGGDSANTTAVTTEVDMPDIGVATNAWFHVLATFNAGVMKIYINGTERSSDDNSSSLSNNAAFVKNSRNVTIGSSSTYGDFWDGSLADVRLYNLSLIHI